MHPYRPMTPLERHQYSLNQEAEGVKTALERLAREWRAVINVPETKSRLEKKLIKLPKIIEKLLILIPEKKTDWERE